MDLKEVLKIRIKSLNDKMIMNLKNIDNRFDNCTINSMYKGENTILSKEIDYLKNIIKSIESGKFTI